KPIKKFGAIMGQVFLYFHLVNTEFYHGFGIKVKPSSTPDFIKIHLYAKPILHYTAFLKIEQGIWAGLRSSIYLLVCPIVIMAQLKEKAMVPHSGFYPHGIIHCP